MSLRNVPVFCYTDFDDINTFEKMTFRKTRKFNVRKPNKNQTLRSHRNLKAAKSK